MILRQGYSALYFTQKSNICRNPSMQHVKGLKSVDQVSQRFSLERKSEQLPDCIDALVKVLCSFDRVSQRFPFGTKSNHLSANIDATCKVFMSFDQVSKRFMLVMKKKFRKF